MSQHLSLSNRMFEFVHVPKQPTDAKTNGIYEILPFFVGSQVLVPQVQLSTFLEHFEDVFR